MTIRKAVITSAGRGTRMRYITNVLPKALLPIFENEDGTRVMVPIVNHTMRSLKSIGVEEFCVVIDSSKRSRLLQDHLKNERVSYLKQKNPRGFGDAVLVSEEFVKGDPIILHTDDITLTGGYALLLKVFEQKDANAVFFLRKVSDPSKYGIVNASGSEKIDGHEVYKISSAEEKPGKTESNLAIVGVYAFSPKIFTALRSDHKEGVELALTSGINTLVKAGGKVYGILMKDEQRLNVGDPDSYFKALEYTFKNSK